jgi:hypothetical protein
VILGLSAAWLVEPLPARQGVAIARSAGCGRKVDRPA